MIQENPLVVQADRTVLVEVDHPRFEEARVRLARFAELEKSPEFVHFYRITPISVWNAAALGESIDEIVDWMQKASRYPVAQNVIDELREWHSRYGLLRFEATEDDGVLRMVCDDAEALNQLLESPTVSPFLDLESRNGRSVRFSPDNRGVLKHCLVKLGYPVQDEAGYSAGEQLVVPMREQTRDGSAFALRGYQQAAADAFWAAGSVSGGCGVVVLPCGAGKTVVGMAAMSLVGARTLILTTNTVAVRQWRRELLDKTDLREEDIGEYTGAEKRIAPVTVATYQVLTYRRRRSEPFVHFGLLERGDWGLIIYDEVHLLPAPVFRATAAIQARRRLGLTATLVREDGKEGDVFSLIGPKRYEVPWRELERSGYLAAARCVEVRVPMERARAERYRTAGSRARAKVAAENEGKLSAVGRLLAHHRADRVMVIGQYLDQVRVVARTFGADLITGRTPMAERERLFAAFREGRISTLVVSRVGNFAIDLPDANVLIQVSGQFGSRQEEAQRLGRILRPKGEGGGSATFYALVSEDSCDEEFSARRQLFLAEQGYSYEIVSSEEMLAAEVEA